jgi:energy-coupling factor transporter ATP-binding protein EcfA2
MSEADKPESGKAEEAEGNGDIVLEARGIDVAFGKTEVLKDLSLDVRRGEILGFVGASGSGKSVLLRTILGLNKKQAGTIRVFGVDLDHTSDAERMQVDMRIGVLVFPRLVALVIVLPCLTITANFAAIGGAMVVAWLYSGIPPEAFLDRMRDAIDLNTIWAGLIKAPFMAMIIGIIASVEGMKVGGSAESLGERVTASVVKSIFVVIVVDGMFAIFYAAINF